MRYRYFVDFRYGISVFAIFSYGVAVLYYTHFSVLLDVLYCYYRRSPKMHNSYLKWPLPYCTLLCRVM